MATAAKTVYSYITKDPEVCGGKSCIDEVLFERAAPDDRVFATNDRPAEAIAIRWLQEGRRFRGMVAWPVETYEHRSIGDLALDVALPFVSTTISRPMTAIGPRCHELRVADLGACQKRLKEYDDAAK